MSIVFLVQRYNILFVRCLSILWCCQPKLRKHRQTIAMVCWQKETVASRAMSYDIHPETTISLTRLDFLFCRQF